MKSLKSKIRTPFLILIVVIPLLTLITFNIAVRAYVNRNARSELRAVAQTVETVAKGQLGSLRSLTPGNLDGAFVKLYRALHASRLAANTDMLLFSRERELLYPAEETGGLVGDALLEQVSKRLPTMEEGQVYTAFADGEKYFLLAYPLTSLAGTRPTIVFVSEAGRALELIRFVNLILLGILLFGVALAVYSASRLSERIVRPVAALCGLTERIGRGEFSPPPQPEGTGDIFELDALYRSIRETAARLESYDRAQKTFLQNASHELKTPLMSIQGYAEGIAGGVLPDAKRAADIIGDEAQRLSRLVEELLTLSRIESHTYTKELISANLCDILKEYAQRLGGLAAKRQRRLSLSLPETGVFAPVDDTLLSQAVMNIVSNCLRYAKTAVTVQLTGTGENAVIRIADDGEGIAEADLPHIFERFYKGKGGSFGLGLAIAKSAVEFMGGTIAARNGEEGAAFEITLPKTPGKNEGPPA